MRSITKIQRLEDTIIRFGGNGDNWHMSWADNDKQYVSLCDGTGLPGTPPGNYNSRIYAIRGNPPDVKFEFIPDYPELQCPTRYYNFGILALDNKIFSFLSTTTIPWPWTEENDARFIGVKLIYSPDKGKTWCNQDGSTPVKWEQGDERNNRNMIFYKEPGDCFSLLTVLQMGKNYSENTDGYVYIYAPNGNTEGTMNQLVLCRVPKNHITERSHYEFLCKLDKNNNPRWSTYIEDRGVVHTFPAGWVNKKLHPYAWYPSVVYYPPTGEYLMANWGMGCTPDGVRWFGKPSYLGFWTARSPWGPWRQVHEETAWIPAGDKNARAYQPQIAPKWIAKDGKSFWLVWTDFQNVNGKGRIYYAFNAQKVQVTIK